MAKEEKFIISNLDQIMSDRFGRYSKYIIQDRALPDARDGLKPVQRRILFSMSELGLWDNKAFKKSARVVGDVIGKYHPHGDSSIYEAMVRMSQDWKMNVPLIEMHGNNGSIDNDPAAAMRYTEARLSKITRLMLEGINKNSVKFSPNFDDSEREPSILPGLMPNLLVNGAKGIAAGYATEMPPHNLGEVIDATIARIKSPNCRLETLMQHIKGPDFPTGAIVQGLNGIYAAYERGRGKIIIRSKYELDNSKTKPSITISEIPYGVVKSKLIVQIDEIRFNKKISGIKEVRDESDRNALSIKIDLVPGSNPENIVRYLLLKTDLQIAYSYNNIAIVDKAPKQLTLTEIIDAYIRHQQDVQRRKIKFDLNKALKRLEIVEGLIRVSQITDKVIALIRSIKGSKSDVVNALIREFNFTKLQANAIAELRLYRLSATEQGMYIEEANELRKEINEYEEILSSVDSLNKYIITLLRGMKKNFATPRKTKIEREIEKVEINHEELIKHEEAWFGISRQGYIKRFSNRAYEANELQAYALKENDTLIYLHKGNTKDKLLIFTNKGRYLFVPGHKVQESKFKDWGKHVNDFAAITPEEKIVDAILVNDFSLKAFIVLFTKKGKAKRVKISDFKVARYSKALVAMKLSPGDELIGAKPSNGFKQVIAVATNGKAVKYSEVQLSIQGTKSGGVKGMSTIASDIAAFALANNDDVLGIISQRGGVKRIKVSHLAPMSKTTQGKSMYRLIKGNPHRPLDLSQVIPSLKGSFRDSKGLLTFEFNKVDITGVNEGFSLIGPSQTIDGKIFKFNRIHKESDLFENVPSENNQEEEIFAKAEKAIDAFDQLSIDDLLKKIS